MKCLCILFLLFAGFVSCSTKSGQKNDFLQEIQKNRSSDTTIVKENVIGEIAGSAYLKKAFRYYVVVNNDTSDFKPIFKEARENGETGIDLNLPYSRSSKTYAQRLDELRLIVQTAGNEFPLDSLNSLSVGRLILTGDLAVKITDEFKNVLGDNKNISYSDYGLVSDFLLESSLAKDLNEMFNPYSKSVKKITIEKAFFTTREELLKLNDISYSQSEIPELIFDCIVWVRLQNDL